MHNSMHPVPRSAAPTSPFMSKPLNLSPAMAAAFLYAMNAVPVENELVQVAFGDTEVSTTDAGWIQVRGGPWGYEEHSGEKAFRAAYALYSPPPKLLSLAYDMEAMCELFMEDAEQLKNDMAYASWVDRRDRCRAAIAASSQVC